MRNWKPRLTPPLQVAEVAEVEVEAELKIIQKGPSELSF
jgi:hypothetical protein